MAGTAKTIRFTKVVARSGAPHVHTLWTDPAKDLEFKAALAANRVLSVETPRSGPASGAVGFDPARPKQVQLLIFPKSLKPFAGARIVGIKFDLLTAPKVAPGDRRAPPTKRDIRAAARNGAKAASKSAPPSKPAAPAKANVPAKPDSPPKAEPRNEPEAPTPPAANRLKPRSSPPARTAESALLREVQAALKELEAGKTVAAYQRLQHAARRAE